MSRSQSFFPVKQLPQVILSFHHTKHSQKGPAC
jgi:hypothetical protein